MATPIITPEIVEEAVTAGAGAMYEGDNMRAFMRAALEAVAGKITAGERSERDAAIRERDEAKAIADACASNGWRTGNEAKNSADVVLLRIRVAELESMLRPLAVTVLSETQIRRGTFELAETVLSALSPAPF